MKSYSLPTNLVEWIEEQLNRIGTSINQPKILAQSIKKMADFYIEQPEGSTPWNELWCQQAQLAYYFPLNFIRNLRVFEELHRLQFFTQPLHWNEFGVGLGPSLEAFHHSINTHNSILSCQLSEKGLFPRETLTQRMLANKTMPSPHWLTQTPRTLAPQTLNVMSYSLTELAQLPQWIWTADKMIIIEPSTRDDGRRLLELREAALQRNFEVVAPCTHQEDCPLLRESKRDWCHDRLFFNRPGWMIEIEDYLPFSNSTLTLSYLALRKKGNENQIAPAKSLIRVVGDFLNEKGKSRQLICRGPHREFLTFIKKSHTPVELHRGDILVIEEPIDKKGDEVRVSPEQIQLQLKKKETIES
ncbi:MAG: hypothetical protein RJB66_811 [Pseudomonadota bacterium]|jgi:hypothetical protein